MVRDIRIKEFIFDSQTFNTNGDDATVFSSFPLNGEILEVDWNFNRTGSVFLTISGTDQEFFRRNLPSGTSTQVSQPRIFSESTTGSVANADHVGFIANNPIILNVLNAASGTQTLDVTVRYR